ncbi:MAG: hypothetical protein DDT22_00921 [candidate division WS2 bacterium]|nr:hypothetical protein [Candidatus Lithacetigena glycinireducens]
MRLIAVAGMGQVPNGSFEIDVNNDGIPDGWTRHLYPGGIGSFDAGHFVHGSRSYRFTHPGGVGNGGGVLTSDFIETDPFTRKTLYFILWSHAPTMRNIVRISYYDGLRRHLAHQDVYNSTANPGAPAYFSRTFVPHGDARFMRIHLIGGHPDVNVAGNTFFDGVFLGSIPYWGRIRRNFTIPEHGTGATSAVDAGGAFLNFEFNTNIQIVDFHFWAEVRTDSAGTTAFQRFRIGHLLTNEVSTISSTFVVNEFRFPPFFLSDLIMESTPRIFQQLATSSHAWWARGRKLDPFAGFEYIHALP